MPVIFLSYCFGLLYSWAAPMKGFSVSYLTKGCGVLWAAAHRGFVQPDVPVTACSADSCRARIHRGCPSEGICSTRDGGWKNWNSTAGKWMTSKMQWSSENSVSFCVSYLAFGGFAKPFGLFSRCIRGSLGGKQHWSLSSEVTGTFCIWSGN